MYTVKLFLELVAMTQMRTAAEVRAIKLLGQGLNPHTVASAVGLSPGRISQILSDEECATEIMEARFQNLVEHTERDGRADNLEDQLLKALEKTVPYMMRPMEIARVYQIVNSAKRRGQSAPEHMGAQAEAVKLSMPTIIMNKFVTNVNNQVVQVGEKALVTMPSGKLPEMLENHVKPQQSAVEVIEGS